MTSHWKSEAFLKERREALRSLDETKIRDYLEKYSGHRGPEDEIVFFAGVHKARVLLEGLSEEEKEVSRSWLAVKGFRVPEEGEEV